MLKGSGDHVQTNKKIASHARERFNKTNELKDPYAKLKQDAAMTEDELFPVEKLTKVRAHS